MKKISLDSHVALPNKNKMSLTDYEEFRSIYSASDLSATGCMSCFLGAHLESQTYMKSLFISLTINEHLASLNDLSHTGRDGMCICLQIIYY